MALILKYLSQMMVKMIHVILRQPFNGMKRNGRFAIIALGI